MNFNLLETIQILESTPKILKSILTPLPQSWSDQNEGGKSWSPYIVMGHLIHGEKTDWIPRLEIILGNSENKTFTPYDRFAQCTNANTVSLANLLNEFEHLRNKNMEILKSKNLTQKDLSKKGIHPELGPVTLKNLLAAWMVHDQGHISQIVRVIAKQYTDEIGPWKQYMTIINHFPKET